MFRNKNFELTIPTIIALPDIYFLLTFYSNYFLFMKRNKKWHILYCDNSMKNCPITDFIELQPEKHQIKILRFLELLEEIGPALSRPYTDILRDGIHELRITLSGNHVRLLYFFCFGHFIILYHGFRKFTNKVPEKYIRQTIEYREKVLNTFENKELEKRLSAGF